jgi:hypothetical protein
MTQEPIGEVPKEPREIPDALVWHIREHLGEKGIRFFRQLKKYKGRVDCVISEQFAEHIHAGTVQELRTQEEVREVAKELLNGLKGPLIPHPVHFREGMWVRNRLRESDLTDDWTDHDFDNNWARVVELAIEEEDDTA